MKLKNNLGYIRSATPLDAQTLAFWWADGKVMEHAGFPNGIKTDINKLTDRLNNQLKSDTLWIIEDIHHQPIGEMHHSIKNGTATLGIKICNQSKQGKGIGPAALKRLIRYLFEELDTKKISLDTMIENTRAQHVYESLHFQKTKISEDVWKDQLGNLRTSVDYELSQEIYTKNKSSFE